MTVSQLFDALRAVFPQKDKRPVTERYEFGLKGICNIYHCSISTAVRIKKSGKINSAISPSGNTFAIDREKAVSIYPPKH